MASYKVLVKRSAAKEGDYRVLYSIDDTLESVTVVQKRLPAVRGRA